MTNVYKDFIGKPDRVNLRVKGITGSVKVAYRGTVLWHLQDDDGQVHPVTLENTMYCPDLPMRLLSPQHMAQVYHPTESMREGTTCLTTRNRVVLTWKDRKHQRTVPLNTSNVAVIWTAPMYANFSTFSDVYGSDTLDATCFPAHLIPPDDDDPVTPAPGPAPNIPSPISLPRDTSPITPQNQTEGLTSTSFDLTDQEEEDKGIAPVQDDAHVQLSNPSDELLYWHYRLGHLPFSTCVEMAKVGDLPARLAKCRIPTCAACRFGKATRVPWRTRGQKDSRLRKATSPGECVSVDQMESTTPGLVAQLKGSPTNKRYRHATVFVDHYSRFTFVFLQQTLTSEETLRAKQAFEAFARGLHVEIKHYHADNGRFADNAFLNSIKEKDQTISFCGVNAHWQSGIAEKRIRDLSDMSRTQLIHAKNRWPKAIEAALWPYAIRYSATVANSTINSMTKETPFERFACVKVKPKLKHFHPFGCPAYVVADKIQASKALPRWSTRARVGVYLGPSPRHARSVALILNLETGLVSPQYHVRYDDFFETVKEIDRRLRYLWQTKCRFIHHPVASKAPKDTSDTKKSGRVPESGPIRRSG